MVRLLGYLPPLLFAAACVLPIASAANVIYTYTGNPYTVIVDETPPAGHYDTTMRVSGMFETASALLPNTKNFSPLNFSFSDGRNTFTDSNSNFTNIFLVSTDAAGQIFDWHIVLAIAGLFNSIGDQILQVVSLPNEPEHGDIFECLN